LVNLRFSPNLNCADRINWLPWGEAAFNKAQSENKPVLLSISAVWCYWCHVMDETSYSDPGVQALINDHFVAVRADNDHRPDVNARYNIGGWPTTAFLTAHGGLIGGATYLPPDQFIAMLAEFKEAYLEDRPALYDQARSLLRQRQERANRVVAGPEVEESLVDMVSRTVAGAYDAVNGGFGLAPKFPNGPILDLLVHLARTTGEEFYRVMLEKTLAGMCSGPLYDGEEGGFFRHSANADWSGPQWEKLLEDNVILCKAYLDAYSLLGKDGYLTVASQCADYLMEKLYDESVPGFRGSQGAHSEYFGLLLSARQRQAPPPIDPSCYSSTNAQAVSLLLDAAWRLMRPALTETALRVLDLIDSAAQGGKLSHVFNESGPSGEPAFLTDWAYLLIALVDAHKYTGQESYLDRAITVASELLDRFFDESHGGFFDIESDPQAIGYLRLREKPLLDNVAAVTALLNLYQVTRNQDYRQVAEAALSAFTGTYKEWGEYSAGYGIVVDRFKNDPVEVSIEGLPEDPSTRAMLNAAYRLSCANLVIKPVMVDELQLPAQAHVCLDTLCLPPVTDPDLLSGAVSGIDSAGASPFENILDRLAGF
jgi:uncharacterized protein YyaL (SSP411 family)